MGTLTAYEGGIFAIDADYIRPRMAAIHLIVEDGHATFVDTGCNASLPRVLAALEELDVPVGRVDYVILTHIHLEHAGGAGAMMQAFPNARLVVHPRGTRHMADPSRLIEGTIAVYGADKARQLYGTILPIDAARMIEAHDGLQVDLAGRKLLCLDTPGHARHHISIVDEKARCIFSGDNFGISYPETDHDGRQLIFPTTTPVQLEPKLMQATIDRLMSYRPEVMYLTHFGQLRDPAAHAVDLHRQVDAHVAIARREKDAGAQRHGRIRDGLAALLLDEARRFGSPLAPAVLLDVFASDLELNAQGLGVWLDSLDR